MIATVLFSNYIFVSGKYHKGTKVKRQKTVIFKKNIKMKIATLILATFSIVQLNGANIDSHFAVDPEEVQLKEISDTVRQLSGAVMGLTEYVMEMRNELKTIRSDILESRSAETLTNATSRPHTYYSGRPIRNPEIVRKQSLELADKVERLLAMDQSPEVDLAKEELRRTVEKNFLRMLAAILVTGPAHTQERSDDIFKLMRSVLNGELDFTPVVQRLPLILRDSETNQFVNLLITLRESERAGGGSFRLGLYSSVEDAAQVAGGSSRQIIPNFQPIPNSPNQLLGTIPNPNVLNPPFQNNFPSSNYQNNFQQNNNIRNPNINNINNNRVPPRPNNNNYINNNNNNNNVNNNNINNNNNNNNGHQTDGNQVGGTQTQNPNGNPQLPSINSLIDAMSQTEQLFKEIPSLVEGLQTLVESLEGLIG